MVEEEEDGRRGDGWVPVCLVEDYELLPALGEGDFLLGEAFDSVADYIDTCRALSVSAHSSIRCTLRTSFVTGVEF